MQSLMPIAQRAGALLKERKETIVIAESSTGGLISAALLAVPGASAYFLGGAVVYTITARRALLGLEMPDGMRASTEAYALHLAKVARERFDAAWALSETGAAGPTGNRYGDAAGHSCIGIVGAKEHAITIETGKSDRAVNMRLFGVAALEELVKVLSAR